MFCAGQKKKKGDKNVCYYTEDGRMRQERRSRGDPSSEGGDTGPPSRQHSINSGCSRTSVTVVELHKKPGCNLGLVVTGGIDKDLKPRISYLKPGGIAHRSDVLEEGDYILSVNGVRTAMMKHDEIVNMLRAATDNVILELEYQLPEPPQSGFSVLCKRIAVELDGRDGDSFGFTIRGGVENDASGSRPLTITQIRPGGAADREGTLKVGDRVLGINGIDTSQCTLVEALNVLRHSRNTATLLVEYDVSVMDAVEKAAGPLLVEIDKAGGSPLGIGVTSSVFKGNGVICIDCIQPASIADRCGALHVGDHILAIDETSFEHVTVAEATQILKCTTGSHVRLEIVPIRHIKSQSQGSLEREQSKKNSTNNAINSNHAQTLPASKTILSDLNSARRRLEEALGDREDNTNVHNTNNNHTNTHQAEVHSSQTSLQSFATYTSLTTQMGSAVSSPHGTLTKSLRASGRSTLHRPKKHGSSSQGSLSYANVMLPGNQVCHAETTEVVLVSDLRGFGISLGGTGYPEEIMADAPFISFIEPKSVAERCGVIHEGDRVLAINGTELEGKALGHSIKLLNESGMRITLLVEFDVAESVVQCSGIFNVKVARNGTGLGITISAPKNRKGNDPLVISDVKPGSVAYRTGTIQPGDKLLAIDHFRLEGCSVEDAAHILQSAANIVQLRLQKEESLDDLDSSNPVMYTVELQRKAGPLGITISGTEEPTDPIFISGLSEGGLAERTGALHIGDRILSINQKTLRGRTLTDAIKMLQNAGQTVTLKISRPANPDSHKNGIAGKSHDSVDSALESWDSSGLDSNGKGHSRPSLQRDGSGSSTSTASPLDQSMPTPTRSTSTPVSTSSPYPSSPGPASSYNDLSREMKFNATSEHSSSKSKYYNSTHSYTDNVSSVTKFTKGAQLYSDSSGVRPQTAKGLDTNLEHTRPKSGFVGARSGLNLSHENSVLSSLDQDEWSKEIDQLDSLGTLAIHSQSDSFSAFNQSDMAVQNEVVTSQHEAHPAKHKQGYKTATGSSTNSQTSQVEALVHRSDPVDLYDTTLGDMSLAQQQGAELHIQEVEEQLQKIFTPSPAELLKVTLNKAHEPDFGLSLSDGVYEKGVYISAVRPAGPAEKAALLPFDRILQINERKIKEMECQDVVPLISQSGLTVSIVISRNPLAEALFNDDDVSSVMESASMILEGRMV